MGRRNNHPNSNQSKASANNKDVDISRLTPLTPHGSRNDNNNNNNKPSASASGSSQAAAAASASHQSAAAEAEANARSTQAVDTRPLCRFYVLHSNCRFGAQGCAYSHTIPHGMTWEAARKQIPCPYYARGTCKYGEHCQLKHGNDNEDEEEGNLVNTTTTASGQQQQTSSACAAVVTTEANDDSNTCGICLEDVVESGHKKFGLLSCCRHTFCLDCLMEWRKEGSQEAEDRRSCPTCRKHSDYVVPSSRFPANEQEKHRMVTEYKDRLAVIPCKHFNGVLGSCPFGRDCFYAHFNDEGENVKAQDQTMKELVEQKAARSRSRYRHRHGSGGSSGGDDMDMLLSFLRLLDMYGYQRDIYWSDSDDDDSDGED